MKQNNRFTHHSTPDRNKKDGVLFYDESFWLALKVLAELFNLKKPAFSENL